MTERLSADYLIVGCGAVGMAFADVMLEETDAELIIVDRHAAPGGHWNDAYPFVALHQPSAFYGVTSMELSQGRIDRDGLNAGFHELATGTEVKHYFDNVMRHQFLPTGRVKFFPQHDYLGDGRFRSLLTGEEYDVEVRGKTVDATWLNTSVPSTHTPKFSVADGAQFIPPNQLPNVTSSPECFVVIGGGKTAIDTIVWLLLQGVAPASVHWIVPRDSWLVNRARIQPGIEFFDATFGGIADQMQILAEAEDINDIWLRLEEAGLMLRVSKEVMPEMFHGATVSEGELGLLQRLRHVVRGRKVSAIEPGRVTLTEGDFAVPDNTVFVDCSARAIPNEGTRPVFMGDVITPQTVRPYQPVFSAGLIAHVENAFSDEATKNRLCGVVPLPDHAKDWAAMQLAGMMNQFQWSQEPEMRSWLKASRLDALSSTLANVSREDEHKQALLKRMREYMMPAGANLQKIIAAAG
ncbi:MAG: NAD(P)/FAD-dependent oxidoreductase [Pseudomonadota bacterium]